MIYRTDTLPFLTRSKHCRVPEEKCHMVLPEIEEEGEDLAGVGAQEKKLSLTSLLLGK